MMDSPEDNGIEMEPATTNIRDNESDQKHNPSKEDKTQSVNFFKLLSFADQFDYLLMCIGSIGAFGHGVTMPVFFLLFGRLINGFGAYRNDPQGMADEVAKNSLYLVYLGISILGSGWLEVSCWMHTGQRQASKMRVSYLRAILNQEISYFDLKAQTGMLVDSISKDIILVQDAISEKLGTLLQLFSTFIAGFAVGFSMEWKVSLVTVSIVPLMALAGGLYAFTVTRLTSKSQEAYANAGNIADEAITQIRTVYSFSGEKQAIKIFLESLVNTLKLGYKQGLAKGLGLGVTYTLMILSWALVLWYAGGLIRNGDATGGKVITAIFSTMMGGMCLGQAIGTLSAFGKGCAAAFNIFQLIEKPITLDKFTGATIENVKGDLELRNVVFAYPSRPDVLVFKDFSLTIPSGKTVALVGGSGSGKSTVVSLIERFYDPLDGNILLDGVDIRTLQLKWLRDQIGLVNQEPALFVTSIIGNILYGKEDASIQEVEEAAKAANAHTFISELPEGYETQVGEQGIQLSGGQKQRVAIARAMLKNPKVLLLDEATSALDVASEKMVQDALDRLMIGRTTVIVAHRLSTIQSADTIAVIEDGFIVEMGTHEELIEKGEDGAYSKLVRLQEMALGSDGTILSSSKISRTSVSQSRRFSSRRMSSLSDSKEKATCDENTYIDEKLNQASKGYFFRLLKLNKPEWPYALVGSIGAIMAGAINPTFGLLLSDILEAFYNTDKNKMKKDIEKYVLVYVGFGVVIAAIYVLQNYYFGIVGENLTSRVREMMFKAILRNEVGWFDLDENNSKRLTTRLASDATHVRTTIADRASAIMQNLFGFFIASIMSLVIEWRMALVMLATFPLMVGGAVAQRHCLKGFSGDVERAYSTSGLVAGDAISNIRTVAAFNAEDKILALFEGTLRGPLKRSLYRGNISGFFLGASLMCFYCSYALVLWYGSQLVKKGTTDFGSVINVFMVLMMTSFAVADTLTLMPDIIKGSEALESIFSIIDRKTMIDPDDPAGEVIPQVRGDIELENVEFAYPARPEVVVFKGLCLSVQAGQRIAIVGASGSGKSSVISLVERFYDPTSGAVKIDGKDIRRLNLTSLRSHIGLVQQEPTLFATSIYQNILYGHESATTAEVEAASKAANAHTFISSLPKGYKTEVGERGAQLSGGQKQRVAIARAILKNPSILLLDEATSALDAESEQIVQQSLDEIMKGRTTIIVAHRLSTIHNADKIVVIHEGRIVEQGSHDELLGIRGGVYAQLVSIQQKHNGNDNL